MEFRYPVAPANTKMCYGVFPKEPISSFGAYPEHFAHLLYAYHVRVLSKHRAIGISYAYYWLQETTSILPSLDDILRPRRALHFPPYLPRAPAVRGYSEPPLARLS